MQSKKDVILIILALIVFLPSSFYFAYRAWTEQKLRQELAREGISTQAIIQECLGNRAGCSVKYQFEVSLPNQQVKSYQVEETYGCFSCEEGAYLPVRFLPQDPTKAGIEGRNNTGWYVLLYLCSLWLLFSEGIRKWHKRRGIVKTSPH